MQVEALSTLRLECRDVLPPEQFRRLHVAHIHAKSYAILPHELRNAMLTDIQHIVRSLSCEQKVSHALEGPPISPREGTAQSIKTRPMDEIASKTLVPIVFDLESTGTLHAQRDLHIMICIKIRSFCLMRIQTTH